MARTGMQLRRRNAQNAGPSTPSGRAVARGHGGAGAWVRYWFDNSMSGGTPALVAWLSLCTLVLISLFAVFVGILSALGLAPSGTNFFERTFTSLLHSLDPGTIAGDEGSWAYLLTMLLLTIAGLFIVSALIGVIAAGIDAKLADLRRGRSLVLERDHTVILGWSESIFTIIRELALANESRRRAVVVVMAERDKVEMEEEIQAKVGDLRTTRVVCRTGSPMDIEDLALCNHPEARSVVLLGSPGAHDPDSEVIKTLLALTHDAPDGPTVVAQIQDSANLKTATLVGGGRTILLEVPDTVAKLVVQTSRQSGASAVYSQLFSYRGGAIYFHSTHGLSGTFADAQRSFEDACVIGLSDGSQSKLNPSGETPVEGKSLIVLARDDSLLNTLSKTASHANSAEMVVDTAVDDAPTHTLLLGWNDRAPLIVRELDEYAPPGSTLTVLTAFGEPVLESLPNLAVTVVRGSTTRDDTLEKYVVEELDRVLVLCYSDHLDMQAADAQTLVTLLHVRDIVSRFQTPTPVVSEMLDDRNRVLAHVAHVDDVIVSGHVISMVITQLSEDRRLEPVFRELLESEGAEIYLRPAEWYAPVGGSVDFGSLVAGASQRGETALGYRVAAHSHDHAANGGVVINPPKSAVFALAPGDKLVVLSEA